MIEKTYLIAKVEKEVLQLNKVILFINHLKF